MAPPSSRTLAVAVLHLLHERPMHPYEIQRVMRTRHIEAVVKLPRGSLYHKVEWLERRGLVEVAETEREGRRPERTVYRITEAGEEELDRWLRELLAGDEREYPLMAAGLAFSGALPPEEALGELRRRALRLEANVAAGEAAARKWAELPRSYVIEHEYLQAMRRAELVWLNALIADMESERLTWNPAHRRLRVVGGEENR
jgi:DNA-binding PadR family transcriptional regulator